MTDEQTKKIDTAGDKVDKPVKEDEPLSIVEEAKKVRDEIKTENDRRERILADEQKLRANELLGGNSGGNIPQLTPEEELQKKGEEGAQEIVDAFR